MRRVCLISGDQWSLYDARLQQHSQVNQLRMTQSSPRPSHGNTASPNVPLSNLSALGPQITQIPANIHMSRPNLMPSGSYVSDPSVPLAAFGGDETMRLMRSSMLSINNNMSTICNEIG